jgi:hypothetical protein
MRLCGIQCRSFSDWEGELAVVPLIRALWPVLETFQRKETVGLGFGWKCLSKSGRAGHISRS